MPQGFTLWFTGLSGSGKSTLANAVAEKLRARGRLVELLDGDVVRQHLSKGLTFSKEDRDINIRRIGFVASLITRHGGIAITAAISPYRAIRDENRKRIGHFVEVYAKASLEACEQRDPKGLYKKARAGELKGFTGIDDPYEEPVNPEITVDTTACSVDEGAEQIVAKLEALGYLDESAAAAPAAPAEAEHLPDELLNKAAAALQAAGRVHTEVLMREFHVGFATAARIIDKLAERGAVVLK